MAEVTLSGVVKRFGDAVAVDGVDLRFGEGSLSTLLGPSGCGKTTTLRMIAGLEHPSAGRIDIDGRAMFGAGDAVPPEDREIGMVFQSYAVWPHLTVFENVAYPLRVRRLAQAEIAAKVETALRTVRLDHLARRYPAQLSGGQQQRVALARAIVYAPRLLLLDEPLSNLDAQLRDEMRGEIRQLQTRLGLTAIYVTHDQAEALAISDFVVVMNRGRVVQQGAPREIHRAPASRFVAQFLGWTNFLPARRERPGHARVLDWSLPVAAGDGGDAPLCATIRPERLRLDPPPADGQLTLTMRVAEVTFLGDSCACALVAGDTALLARVPAEDAPQQGAELRVGFAPAHLRVIPDDTTQVG